MTAVQFHSVDNAGNVSAWVTAYARIDRTVPTAPNVVGGGSTVEVPAPRSASPRPARATPAPASPTTSTRPRPMARPGRPPTAGSRATITTPGPLVRAASAPSTRPGSCPRGARPTSSSTAATRPRRPSPAARTRWTNASSVTALRGRCHRRGERHASTTSTTSPRTAGAPGRCAVNGSSVEHHRGRPDRGAVPLDRQRGPPLARTPRRRRRRAARCGSTASRRPTRP